MNSQQNSQGELTLKKQQINKKMFLTWFLSLISLITLLLILPIILTRNYFRSETSQLQFSNCQTLNLQTSTLQRLINNNRMEITFIILLSLSAVFLAILSIFLLRVLCRMQEALCGKQRSFFLGMAFFSQWTGFISLGILIRQIVDFTSAQWCILDNQFITYRDNLYLPGALLLFATTLLFLDTIFYIFIIEKCRCKAKNQHTFSTTQENQEPKKDIPAQLSQDKQEKFRMRQFERSKTGSGRKKQNGYEQSSNSKIINRTSASKIFKQRFPSGRKSKKNIFEHFPGPIILNFQQSNVQLNGINADQQIVRQSQARQSK